MKVHMERTMVNILVLLLLLIHGATSAADEVQYEEPECDCDFTLLACRWHDWGPWTSCTEDCGGGIQRRCRRQTTGWICHECNGYDEEQRDCNEWCWNGGEYTDKCECPAGYKDQCCECHTPPHCKSDDDHFYCDNSCDGHISACMEPRCTECVNDAYYVEDSSGQCRECDIPKYCETLGGEDIGDGDYWCSEQDSNDNCVAPSSCCRQCQNDTASHDAYHLDSENTHQCLPRCNWLGHYCWPGVCDADEHYLATTCTCIDGFELISSDEYTNCQLTQEPDLQSCWIRATAKSGDIATSKTKGNTTDCSSMVDTFINFQVQAMEFDLSGSFQLPDDPPSGEDRHVYISGFRFGVTQAVITVGVYNQTGSYNEVQVHTTDDIAVNSCTIANISQDYPVDMITCQLQHTYDDIDPLEDGQKICHNFQVFSSGYVDVQDMMLLDNPPKREYYKSTASEKEVCFHVDLTPPNHCSLQSCKEDMLNLGKRIRREKSITVSMDGWFDPEPDSSVSTASGIKGYEIEVKDVLLGQDELYADFDSLVTYNTTGEPVHITLPDRESHHMFAIYLSALDSTQAGPNYRKARRFVLVDNVTVIETDSGNPIIVSSASNETDYKWQTELCPVTIMWLKHFYNNGHIKSNLLITIRAEGNISISGPFEQDTGELPVSGTPNNDGIVNYLYKYHWISENNKIISEYFNVSSPLNETIVLTEINITDGDWINVTIQAIDVMNNTMSDNTIVKVDSSEPEIRDMFLYKDGYRVLVHNNTDLTTMDIQFEVFDKHSGLNRIYWMLGKQLGIADIDSRYLPIAKNSSHANCSTCYCPMVYGSECENYAYSTSVNHNINGSHIGDHNREYYLTLEVRNEALLTTTKTVTLLVDSSPPESGHVFDGPPGEKNRDFQSDPILYWHWTGFIDHESDISKYHIAIGHKCFTKEDLQFMHMEKEENDNDIVHFVETLHELYFYTVQDLGFYQISVIAFNGAMEPSDVVCSSGVVYDNTAPEIYNIQLIGSVHQQSILCFNESIWLVDKSGISYQLHNVSECSTRCNEIKDETTNKFPMVVITNKTSRNYFSEEDSIAFCKTYPLYDNEIPVFLHVDNIHIAWNVHEEESQMNDYYIEILDFEIQRTHNHTTHKCISCGIGQGDLFHISITAENKPLLTDHVNIGPVIIDATPPVYIQESLIISTNKTHVILSWSYETFRDEDYDIYLDEYEWAIGTLHNAEEVVTFTYHVFPYDYKMNHTFFEVACPIEIIQNHDQDVGSEYYFTLKVFNKANLFHSERSPPFSIHSKVLPSSGIVHHIDPENLLGGTISFQQQTDVLCIRWNRFYHYSENITYFISIGLAPFTDDIIQIFEVSSIEFYCIRNLSLDYNKLYFATITARTNQGEASSSTNGVYISTMEHIFKNALLQLNGNCPDKFQYELDQYQNISNNTDSVYNVLLPKSSMMYATLLVEVQNGDVNNISDIVIIYDQTVLSAKSWQYEINNLKLYYQFIQIDDNITLYIHKPFYINIEQISLDMCQISSNIQALTDTIKLKWFFEKPHKSHFDRYILSLTESMSGGNITSETETAIDLCNTITISSKMQHEYLYKACLSPCFTHNCLIQKVCVNYTIDINSPEASFIGATLDTEDGQLIDSNVYRVKANWNKFQQAAFPGSEYINVYDWSVAIDRNGGGLMLPWKRICERDTDTIEVNETVYLHPQKFKSMYFMVRTTGENSMVSLIGTPIKLLDLSPPSGIHTFDLPHNYNLDAIKQYLGSANLGLLSRELHNSDIDFTSNAERISGALLGIICNKYTWALQENIDGDCRNHETKQCLSLKENNENVVTFTREKFTYGTNYTICVSGSGNCPSFRSCSNGFVFDNKPPLPGIVQLGTGEMNYFTDSSSLLVSWNGFTDIEEDAHIPYVTGIYNYSLSIGTVPYGSDVQKQTNVGMSEHSIYAELHLLNGRVYYATITACDHTALCTSVTSNGRILDNTPPDIDTVTIYHSNAFRDNMTGLYVRWNGIADSESGISKVEVSLSSNHYGQDILPYTCVNSNDYYISQNQYMHDGNWYVANIKTTNEVGLWTIKSSLPVFYDSSAPNVGFVRHGLHNQDRGMFTTDDKSFVCHWGGFSDQHSGIFYYRVAVGTKPYKADAINWQDVGQTNEYQHDYPLTHGQAYYITVKACNGVFLCSQSVSSPLISDISAPIPGIVKVGYSEEHEQYLYNSKSISVKWEGFHDLQSNIANYYWCISSSDMECDILSWQQAHKSTHVTKPDIHLPVNKTMFVLVKASNNVNMNATVKSKHFIIDDSPPEIIEEVIIMTNSSIKKNTQFDRSYISLEWKMIDYESPMMTYTVGIHPHHSGVSPMTMQFGDIEHATIPLNQEQQFKDGNHYTVKVTGCNAAQLCITSVAEEILVDSTPPILGGFIEPMFWFENSTGIFIQISWYGFEDPHSEINQYYIMVSSTYNGYDLSGEIITTQHSTNEKIQKKDIQLTTVPGNEIVLSIWAENNVGLMTDAAKATVIISDNGQLEITKHSCDVHYCNHDCTCAIVNGQCTQLGQALTCHESNGTSNDYLQVFDGVYDQPSIFTPSSVCLPGYWKTFYDPEDVTRYEWSVSVVNGEPGSGVLDILEDKVLFDVELYDRAVYCTSEDSRFSTFIEGETYIFHVSVWHNFSSYTHFTSRGVVIDNSAPYVGYGKHVLNMNASMEQEIHFTDDINGIYAQWKNVFSDPQSGISHFLLAIGTSQGGNEIFGPENVGLQTNFSYTDIKLQNGFHYYTTIYAYNNLNMVSSSYSKGLIVDLNCPSKGFVFAGMNYKNQPYQTGEDGLSFSWYGFVDQETYVKSYKYAITNIETTPRSKDFIDVLLQNQLTVHDNFKHGESYIAHVKASDAAGHESDIVTSDKITIDDTPPELLSCLSIKKVVYNNTMDCQCFETNTKLSPCICRSNVMANTGKGKLYQIKLVVNVDLGHNKSRLEMSDHMEWVLPIRINNGHFEHVSYYVEALDRVFIPKVYIEQHLNTTITLILSECHTKDYEQNSYFENNIIRQWGLYGLFLDLPFYDAESGIKSIQIGMGTNNGGFQIQPMIEIGKPKSFFKPVMEMLNKSHIHTVIIVTNNAGLKSNFTLDPLQIDWSLPEIHNVNILLSYGVDQNITVTAEWNTMGNLITDCMWAIGHSPSSLELQDWKSTDTLRRSSVTLQTLKHGDILFVTIKCFNHLNMYGQGGSLPETVVLKPPSAENAHVKVYAKQYTAYLPVHNTQISQQEMEFSHYGFEDASGIRYYEYQIPEYDADEWKNIQSQDFVYLNNLNLQNNEYTVNVRAVNKEGHHSSSVGGKLRVDNDMPELTGKIIEYTYNNYSLHLNWADIFKWNSQKGNLIYDVIVGTTEGSSELLKAYETMETSVIVTSKRLAPPTTCHCVLVAIAPSGMYEYYRELIHI